jgi:ATP-dependent Clp protease ATP-binding subunit ClpA
VAAGLHPDYVAFGKRLADLAPIPFSTDLIEVVTADAPAAARGRDDDHVGTEHLLLGLYRHEASAAAELLMSLGITSDTVVSVATDEPGTSPDGTIPMTDRSRMTLALAIQAARDTRSNQVGELHLLLGAVSESRLWESFHSWGPHHLRDAAIAVYSSVNEVERRATVALGRV